MPARRASHPDHLARRPGRFWLKWVGVPLAAVLVTGGVVAGIGIPSSTRAAGTCQQLFVPAFFSPGPEWSAVAASSPVPATMILDITSLGAGTAPIPAFQSAVARMRAKGITVLGYSTTSYGQRSVAQVEQDVRNYKAWYGVTGVFLDQASSSAAQLPYYRALNDYVHRVDPGAPIWLNPGTYPARSYMSLGDVVMAFEGPYSSFAGLRVPAWASDYSASRFAFVIYDAADGHLSGSIWLAKHRRGGNLYITDGTGGNPYSSLPSYWTSEVAQVPVNCPPASAAPAN